MSIRTLRLGPAEVYIPQKVATLVPMLTALTTATLIVAATAPDEILNNSQSPTLDTSADYYVSIAPLGGDTTSTGAQKAGLTLAGASTGMGPINVNDGEGIMVRIPANAIPADLDKAYAMGVFLRKNNGSYKLVDYAYIDVDNGFNYMVMTDADTLTGYDLSVLMATAVNTSYPELGGRRPTGVVYSKKRTSGGVTVNMETEGVDVAPDDGRNYNLPTSRISSLQFSIMENDMKEMVLANAGKYGAVQSGGATFSFSNMGYSSAVAQITGNIPFKLRFPPDANKVRQITLFLAMIGQNTGSTSMQWSKDSTTLVEFTVDPVNNDDLLSEVSTEIGYKYYRP